ncbi:type II secretion system minor pseudopilin GspK [Hyphomonas sp.]|uniref:type II secretion system minor pseudopilin GspK n=1 Tax=Hyphomonas sp. TaxID=87 RepID=UPI0025C67270|nr:type II secretion system minor pseudopilin GspK [Hyphomonas sp.]
MIPASRQAGAALLSILLIVATLSVAAVMATGAIARQTAIQKLGARRAVAAWAARSAEAAALASASDLVSASRLPPTGDGADRAQTVALPVEGGQVVLTMQEQRPCFNLNTLGDPDPLVREQRSAQLTLLLEELGVRGNEADALIATLADWIDTDTVESPAGAEDTTYLSREDGFRVANQPLRSLKELAALPGFTADLRTALAAHTCAAPGTDMAPLNLNAFTAADAPLVHAVTQGTLSLAEARRFIDARPATGWASLEAVQTYAASRPALEQALTGLPLTVRGEYFVGRGDVQLDAGSWPFRFILRAGTAAPARIVWHTFGDAG